MNFEDLKSCAAGKIAHTGDDVVSTDADLSVFLLDHCEITIAPEHRFFGKVNTDGIFQFVIWSRAEQYSAKVAAAGLKDGVDALAYTGLFDFSHTTTMWDDVLSLGLIGIRNRLADCGANASDDGKRRFYSDLLRVWDAVLRFLRRASVTATACGKEEMAKGLSALAERAPSTLYEAMQTIIVYYNLQMFFDGTYLRTLGRLDRLLYPFYEKEPTAERKELIFCFLQEIDQLDAPANIPFAIGGTDENGAYFLNELSFDLVEQYRKANTNNTKFHILYSEKMPDEILRGAFEAIRENHNSIVFMNDRKIVETLIGMGEDRSDATDYHIVGCYECGGRGELTCSCNGRVNIPKAIEVALNGGRDLLTGRTIGLPNDGNFPTFDDFFAEVKRQLSYFSDCAVKCTDLYEEEYRHIHSAPILSATYPTALDRGGDLYCAYTAKYNNSSINAVGLGTAVDSLVAIKKIVYEDRTMTLSALADLLANDWEGNEVLRLTVKNRYDKWGMGIGAVDRIGGEIIDVLSERINGRKNKKGGVYRLGTFSINWRWEFGEKTAASADGRKRGETLSQNTSATFGADRNGATAHLRSAASFDSSKTPNASIVDIDLHRSAVAGENGVRGLIDSLKGYFALGGFAVHYNVLDTETLKAAYLRPENYPNLQVRLCGWNVLFSSLTKAEQEEFIARSEKD